jgi:hypothetical protein
VCVCVCVLSIAETAISKEYPLRRLLAGFEGSNPAGTRMFVKSFVCADISSRGVLPIVIFPMSVIAMLRKGWP